MKLKAMTFNMRINVTSDGENAWPNRVDAVIDTIRQSEAVIIGTQELSPLMLRDLEERLTEFGWVGEGRRGGLNDELSAVFYRKDIFKVIDNGTFWLSENPEIPGSQSWDTAFPRICTWAKLKHADGGELYFFNTHLDHISSDARLNGIKKIVDKMLVKEKENKLPVILTGDFNIGPDSNVIRYLKNIKNHGLTLNNVYDEYSSVINQMLGCTFHDFKGGNVGEPIDYIFVSSDIKIKDVLINRNMVNGKYPSDHYPVSAFLEI
jgi:endonuclease/exonuclease/phosphatase family metal-dependent hydrolase